MVEPVDLDRLPILREIGVMVHATAAIEDERDARKVRGRRFRLRACVRWAAGTPYRAAGIGAIVGVIAAAVLFGVGVQGSRLDPVAAADAALNPPGAVVHLVLQGGAVQPDGTPLPTKIREHGTTIGTLGRRIERWSTAHPFRQRVDTLVVAPDGSTLGVRQRGVGSDGARWEAESWNGTVQLGTASGTTASTSPLPDGRTPALAVQHLLHAGLFEAQGATMIRGRTALRFVATIPARHSGRGNYRPASRIAYFVDAKTYMPLQIRSYIQPPARDDVDGPSATSRHRRGFILIRELRVARYERVPLNRFDPEFFRAPLERR